eukprot:scpid87059/ scgid28216/ Probable histidinol-phosphatase
MPFSFHSHSAQFCKHASGGPLAEVVEEARCAGFLQFGLSEHMPRQQVDLLYEEEIDAGMSCDDLAKQFSDFVAEARRLQKIFDDARCSHNDGDDGGMEILVGAETEYVGPQSIGEILQLRHDYKLDYIVGSIHHVRGKPIDFSKETFEQLLANDWNNDHTSLFSAYFDEQFALFDGVRPEVAGHLDVVRKYCPGAAFSATVLEKVRRNIKFCVDHGILLEINSSGVGKGLPHPYPQQDVLTIAKELGARFTLGDDAHSPVDVAQYYSHIRQYVHDMAIESSICSLHRTSSCHNKPADAMHECRQDQQQRAAQNYSFSAVESQPVPDFLHHHFWSRSPVYELAV